MAHSCRVCAIHILLIFALCFWQNMATATKGSTADKGKAHKASSPHKTKHSVAHKKVKEPKTTMKEGFDYFYEQKGKKGVFHKRPKWSNDITIELDKKVGTWSVGGWGWSTLHVSGTIIPMNYKSDRPPTPDTSFDGTKRNLGGCSGYQKGHIIGLELGGPNVQQNIAPQTASWQAAGQWRYLEKDIVKECEACYGWENDDKLTVAKAQGPDTRKKKQICEINMWIKFWKENIPSNYWGYLQCGGKRSIATAEKIKFEIYQPRAPYQPPYKFNDMKKDCAAHAVAPLNLFTPENHDGVESMVRTTEFESMQMMAVLSVFAMLLIAVCITCLCGCAIAMGMQRWSRQRKNAN